MRRAEQGFTLVEMLVALAVFSVAVVALLNVSGESTRTAYGLEERVLASVVAENRAVETMSATAPPALGQTEGVERLGERDWRWTRRISATSDADVLRVDVIVRPARGAAPAGELTVFRAAS